MSNFIKKVVTGFATSALVLSALVVAPMTASAASAGEVYKGTDGTVYFITSDMQKRPFTSFGAFQSYGFLSVGQIKAIDGSVTALPTGSFIAPADGKIFCATVTKGSDVQGECSLITGGMKAAFTSAAVFGGQGFSFSRAVYGDSSFLSKTANIDTTSAAHRMGVLVNNSGTVQMIVNGGLWGIPSIDVFNTWGYSFADVVPANGADKVMAQIGVIPARAAGQLVPSATTSPAPQGGPISASLGAGNPAAGNIVSGQATAKLLELNISGSGTVSSLTFHRSGISDQNTLTNVYLYDGASRLTDGYSFNSTGDLTMGSLNLAVNGVRTISVVADVASGLTSGTIMIALNSITASGSPATPVSVIGNSMNIVGGSSLATVNLGVNSLAGATPTVNAGLTNYVFWSAPLQVNTRTLQLKSANFRMIGSAPTDALANIKLFVDGVDSGSVGTVAMANGSNYVTFNFSGSPKSLTTGSHTVDVRADIQKGSSRTVQFSIQNASDLMIFDPQVGVNLAVTGPGGVAFTANAGANVTIGTGSITAVLDPVFQALTNVTGGASNVDIAKFKLHAYGEDVKINTLQVLPVLSGTTPAPPGLQNVTLYFNGSQVGSQQNWTSGNLTFNLGAQLIVPAGTDSSLEVRADVRTSAGVNYTAGSISANLVVGSSNAQGQNSQNTLSTPALTGNVLTIQTGLLSVGKNTGYANQNVNPNTAGVKIGSFVLQNQSSSEAVRVTNLNVNVAYTVAGSTNLSALRTSETSGSGSIPQQPATAAAGSNATNSFSVDFVLAPGATKIIDILADTSTATGGATVITTLTVNSIGATSNVSAVSAGIVGQTITLASGSLATPTILTATSTVAQYIAAGNGGATAGSKATYNFVSTGGASTISELTFSLGGTPNAVTSVTVNGTTAPVVGTTAYMTGLSIAVPNGGSGANVDVLLNYSEVGTSGIAPGSTATLTLTTIKSTSGGTTTTSTVSVAAPTMTLVGSKPTLVIPSTQQTGLAISGVTKIGEVTVTADAKGNVKLNTLVFTVSSSGFSTAPTAIGSPVISNSNSASTPVAGSSCTAASLVVTCHLDTDAGASLTNFDGLTVSPGSPVTLSLFGSLTGAAAIGSGTPTITSSIGASTFSWDDSSTNGGAGSTNLNGTLIYQFPTNSFSIRQ